MHALIMTLVAVIVCLDTTNKRHLCLVSEVLGVLSSKVLRIRNSLAIVGRLKLKEKSVRRLKSIKKCCFSTTLEERGIRKVSFIIQNNICRAVCIKS